MGLRWGFKKEAESTAIEIRDELGLRKTDPLDPWRLAKHLEIPIRTLSEFDITAPFAARFFAEEGESQFSAVTVFRDTARVIVHHDAHSRARQASDIAHELSHALLGHPPTQALDDRGCRLWDQTVEDEANWHSGVLLVPAPAAWLVAAHGYTLKWAADHYGVSEQMMRFRLNMTGANKANKR
jgi:Zn-dependent peptidase ImmA (M78 family)